MNPAVAIIGIGEVAGVLAKAFLRNGHPVFPVTRDMGMTEVARELSDPLVAVIGVAEKDFSTVLKDVPESWRDRLAFIQNELLPHDWENEGIVDPTVLSVWFEKKRGTDYKPLLPTQIFGPRASWIADALTSIEIPCSVLESQEELLYQLVLKNVFILTTNLAGLALEEGATTATLWGENRELALDIANDSIDLQQALVGKSLPRQELLDGLVEGLGADPHHKCKGRSAPVRLARAIEIADEKGVEIPAIRALTEITA